MANPVTTLVTGPSAALLRATLAVVLLGALAAQVLVVPAWAGGAADRHPDVAHLAVPYAAAAVVAIAGVQAALLAVWRLLALVRADAIFSDRALRWVDAAAVGVGGAAALSGVVAVHLAVVAQVGGPALPLGLACAAAAGVAAVLLLRVARGLLRTATGYRAEMRPSARPGNHGWAPAPGR